MTLRKGLPVKLGATDADDTRLDFRNLVVCNADGSPRGGVTAPVGANLVSATASMNVSVAAFSAVAVRDGGCVLLANDGPTNVLLGAAPAANSRIDVIYAKQNDASGTVTVPDANNSPVLGVVAGTASPSPSAPAVPVGAVKLAEVLIPSTATATNSAGVIITQSAQYTAAPGGVVPFRLTADLLAWSNPQPGQRADTFAGDHYAYQGANGWQIDRAFAEASGGPIVASLSNVASTILTITFPPGRFTQPPVVTPSIMSSPGVGRKLGAQATGITAAGCQIVVTTGDQSAVTAGVNVGYVAKQMTAANAAG